LQLSPEPIRKFCMHLLDYALFDLPREDMPSVHFNLLCCTTISWLVFRACRLPPPRVSCQCFLHTSAWTTSSELASYKDSRFHLLDEFLRACLPYPAGYFVAWHTTVCPFLISISTKLPSLPLCCILIFGHLLRACLLTLQALLPHRYCDHVFGRFCDPFPRPSSHDLFFCS
jgi:hypothetical protein